MTGGEEMVTLTFTINGTDTNPYAGWGLKCNPFPATGIHELQAAAIRLNTLGGEPVRSEADIRNRLAGFGAEFVDGVVARWQPGVMVHVILTFPRRRP
jgi:hypothetical protein